MQMNTSMIILDPKGEITRDTGHLFKSSGIEVFAAAPFASEFVA
jgi:type IV secretion system protein VirD4